MRLADELLLAQIRESLLSHIPDDQWKQVQEEVEKAGGVREVGGYAGTLIRDAIEKKSKVETVMSEFKSGKLKSSSGKKVKSRKQAIAIALSEQRRAKKKEVTKASFASRSEAGRYAAQQRWKGHTKGQASPETKARITAQARAAAEAKTKFPGVRTVITGEPASPSREQQREFNRFVKLNDERRSLERDIEYTESQLKEMERRMSEHTPNPELDAQARRILLNNIGNTTARLQRTLSNLQAKRDAVNAQIESEFPTPSPQTQPKGSANSFSEDDFPKGALAGLKDNPTYKAGVEARKAEIKRGDDGVARFRGSDLKASRESLKTEEDSLAAFESGKATSRQILGSRFNKTETRAILQARVASARANVQALEEFEDETSPGYFAS